jgi:DinB family protein
MKRILARLDATHRKLLETVEPLDDEILTRRPAEGQWSIAEILNHLRLVEERVIKDLCRNLEQPPAKLSGLRRLVPTSIVASRLIRVKAPKAVVPNNPAEKSINIAELNAAREELKELCATHGKEKLRKTVFKHPFLGPITGVAAISFVNYHEQRHFKQIGEVLRKLEG